MAKKEIVAAASDEALALLRAEFPTEPSFQRAFLPRLGMVSQDQTEGKGKAMKVTTEAGTFFTEERAEDDDEDGKAVFEKTELGDEIEGTIIFERKQLRMYDEATEEFTSSTVYDTDDEEVRLFCNKAEIDRGTAKELQAKYPGVSQSGKPKSKLEENRILYVLFTNENGDAGLYQMNLRGSSMFSYLGYKRKTTPNTVLTRFSSESKEKGSIAWNQMTFTPVRPITGEEAKFIVEQTKEIKDGISQEKAFFAKKLAEDKEFDSYGKGEEEGDEAEFEEGDVPFGKPKQLGKGKK